MSNELKEVKRRIRGTRQIHKVTSAMQKVAAARLGRDRAMIDNTRRYRDALLAMLHDVWRGDPDSSHPLMVPHKEGVTCLVVLGAEKGLCGGYNTSLVDQAKAFVQEQRPRTVVVAAVGQVVIRRLQRAGIAMDHAFSQPTRGAVGGVPAGMAPHMEQLTRTMAKELMTSFLARTYADVHVLYMRFVSGLWQMPLVERILPAGPEPGDMAVGGPVTFEPAAATILARLLPEFVERSLQHALANSLGSEDAARQATMTRASENAGEVLSELMLSFSRLRQEHITAEMIELAGGGVNRRVAHAR